MNWRHLGLAIGPVLLAMASAAAGQASADPKPADVADMAKQFSIIPRCKSGDNDEIVVCGRRNENERYRLRPPATFDPNGSVESVSRERHRLIDDVGDTGIGSCSNVGPGGFTGCFFKDVKRYHEQHAD